MRSESSHPNASAPTTHILSVAHAFTRRKPLHAIGEAGNELTPPMRQRSHATQMHHDARTAERSSSSVDLFWMEQKCALLRDSHLLRMSCDCSCRARVDRCRDPTSPVERPFGNRLRAETTQPATRRHPTSLRSKNALNKQRSQRTTRILTSSQRAVNGLAKKRRTCSIQM